MYYFGCWRREVTGGHLLYRPDGASAWRLLLDGGLPWKAKDIDTGLCQKPAHIKEIGKEQIEGQALLHHKGGWTALAFWDRSSDHRSNSNSVFLIQQTLDFAQMLVVSKQVFPQIWERFKFEVKLAGPVVEW